MKTILDTGDRVGFTPDGPRGPLREIQPGVLYLAQKTGRPIVPVAYGAKRRWIFKGGRWDEFIVPKPFNRIVMIYGDPIHVKAIRRSGSQSGRAEEALDTVSRRKPTASQGRAAAARGVEQI